MSARGYRELTYRLASDLQLLSEIARKYGEGSLADEADALRQRIESRRFALAVVGEFKRGKSTFINALLGAEILPADVLPTSATINRVTFGLTPSATLHFRDGRPPETVPIGSLVEHVTKLTDASAARAATIREAVVAYPLQLCRNDIDLIDTPGLSDEASMTEVTEGLLPDIDAAIVVLMADSPLSSSEAALVGRLIGAGVERLLFVVTAIDRIRREEDRSRIIEAIRQRLRATKLVADEPVVYPVSGRLALDARLEGDEALLAQSGLVALEDGLKRELLRTDGVGLVRRLNQLGEQCGQLLAAMARGASPAADESRQWELLDALLVAAEQGLNRTQQQFGAYSDVVSALYHQKLDNWPKIVAQVSGVVVARHKAKIAPGWLERKTTVIAELAADLEATMRSKLAEELASVQWPDASAVSAELARAATALDVLFPFVAGALSAECPPPMPLRALTLAVPEPAAELLPAHALWQEAIDQPALASLGRDAEKLDFLSKTMASYNLPGQFAKIVTAGISQRLPQHWEQHPPSRWFRQWWQQQTAPVLSVLSNAQIAVRTLRGAVSTASARAEVHREREASERQHDRSKIGEIEARARQLLAELRAEGF